MNPSEIYGVNVIKSHSLKGLKTIAYQISPLSRLLEGNALFWSWIQQEFRPSDKHQLRASASVFGTPEDFNDTRKIIQHIIWSAKTVRKYLLSFAWVRRYLSNCAKASADNKRHVIQVEVILDFYVRNTRSKTCFSHAMIGNNHNIHLNFNKFLERIYTKEIIFFGEFLLFQRVDTKGKIFSRILMLCFDIIGLVPEFRLMAGAIHFGLITRKKYSSFLPLFFVFSVVHSL